MNYIVSFKDESERNNYLRALEAVRVPSAGEMYITMSYGKDGIAAEGTLRQVETMDGHHSSFLHQHEALDLGKVA